MSKTHQATLAGKINSKFLETLYVAIELSHKTWKLGWSNGKQSKARVVSIPAQDWQAWERELDRARVRFGISRQARVISCYEIGREGFWLHRALISRGIENVVVDAASIEVNRRDKRAKTDRMDVEKLVRQLTRHCNGEERVWSVVRVPDEEAEDARHLHRDLEVLKRERRQHRVRIQSLLFTQGIDLKVTKRFLQILPQLRMWNGKPVPEQLDQRLRREFERLKQVELALRELENQQKDKLKTDESAAMVKIRRLQQLRAIGMASSWVFVKELFGWRQFKNRREVAGALGITPTPYQSGDCEREQGISHSGNRRARTMAVEIAWSWLRLQPHSDLSQWYWKRFGRGGIRMRKIGIVALARRLMVDLWRYLEQGIVPAGARLKAC